MGFLVGAVLGLGTMTACVPFPTVPLPTVVFVRNTGATVEVLYCGDWTFRSTAITRGYPRDFVDDGGVSSERAWTVDQGERVSLEDIADRLHLDFDTSPLRPGERLNITTVFSRAILEVGSVEVGLTASFDIPNDWTQDQVDAAWFRSDRTVNAPSC